MTAQKEFTLTPRRRGFHLVTEEIIRNLPPLPSAGILHLFIKHTSAGLTINENADPDVQTDMEAIFNRLVKEREPYYQHTCEGDEKRGREMMKKNLKKAVSLALASVMALSLTACAGSGSKTTTAAQAEGKEAEGGSEDVTIKFCWWGGDSRHEATEKAVDAFMAKYPILDFCSIVLFYPFASFFFKLFLIKNASICI